MNDFPFPYEAEQTPELLDGMKAARAKAERADRIRSYLEPLVIFCVLCTVAAFAAAVCAILIVGTLKIWAMRP